MSADTGLQRSWPQIVGYRHEILHTGVLRHLLDGEMGPRVASALTGLHVAKVDWYDTEDRLPGRKGKQT